MNAPAANKRTFQPPRYVCSQCGKEMNIVQYMLNPVCLKCAKNNHKKATGV